jgi:NADH:ubiquinone oxidoreductase subunit 6 (subunit J)
MAVFVFYLLSFFLVASGTAVIFARHSVHAVLFLILCFFNAAGLFILLGAEFLAMILVIVYVGAVAVLFLFVVMLVNIEPRRETFRLTREQWPIFQKGVKEITRYTFVWFVVFSGLLYGLSWLGAQMAGLPFSAFVYTYIPVVFAPLFFQLTIPYTHSLVSAAFVIVSLLLASPITVAVTRTHFFTALDHLQRGFSVPLLVGVMLVVEFLVVALYWSAGPVTLSSASSAIALPASVLKTTNTHALAPILYKDYVFAFLMSGFILLVAMIGAIVLAMRKRVDVKRQDISRQLARRKTDTLKIRKVKSREGI